MTTMSTQAAAAAWEGLGGPVRVQDVTNAAAAAMDDPTLNACCQREMENNRKAGAVQRALDRHDVVAQRERRRRHLVQALPDFEGCRCHYDPQVDGGEYPALILLRSRRCRQQQSSPLETAEYCVEIGAPATNEQETKEKESDEEDSDDEFDYLLDDDLPGQNSELERIEAQRRAELEMQMVERETALQHGYGVHRQMHPSRVLKAAGLVPGARDPSPAVVLHLLDPDSSASASLDLCLEQLAATTRARGTKFLRSEGRSTLQQEASVLRQVLPRLSHIDLPALIAVKDGVAIQTCANLQYFVDPGSNNESVVEGAVADWLQQLGVLHERPPPQESLCRIRPEEEVLLDVLAKEVAAGQAQKNAAEELFFRCGVDGCQKLFAHEHVGIETPEQSGLVVPAHDIVGES